MPKKQSTEEELLGLSRWDLLICGLVGSHAYGMAHEGSDKDYVGVYQARTEDILGLTEIKETVTNTNPDYAYHELGKFVRLAIASNPAALEVLYLPLKNFLVLSERGKELIIARDLFLSERVRPSYGNYAHSQIMKKQGTPKHIRHCFRLIQQGGQLLRTGELVVEVENPEELWEIGELPRDKMLERFDVEYEKYSAIESVLPAEPNYKEVAKLLVELRLIPLELSTRNLRQELEYAKNLLRAVYRMQGASTYEFGASALKNYLLKDGEDDEESGADDLDDTD